MRQTACKWSHALARSRSASCRLYSPASAPHRHTCYAQSRTCPHPPLPTQQPANAAGQSRLPAQSACQNRCWVVQQLSRWPQVTLDEEHPEGWILRAELASAKGPNRAHLNIMVNVFLLGGIVMPDPRPANQRRVSLSMQMLLES